MVRYTLETYTLEKYNEDKSLVDAVEMANISFDNPEQNRDVAIEILKQLGYKGLRVGSNKSEIRFLLLEKCNPGRINSALRERYFSALSRIKEFGDPSAKTKNTGLEFRVQRDGQFLLFN